MTVKERKLIKGVVAGKTQGQAAIDAGYSEASAAQTASKVLKKATVQEALHAEMARQGITLEAIVAPVKKALVAKTKQRESIRTTSYDEKGRRIETVEDVTISEEDNIPLQLQGADRASKWLGLDKVESAEGGGGSMSPEVLEALASTSDTVTLTQLVFKRGTGVTQS